METEQRQRPPLDVLTYLAVSKTTGLRVDSYPDTGESGEAYDVELSCSSD